jgi:predicted exporter
LTSHASGSPVEQGKISADKTPSTAVYFSRAPSTQHMFLGGEAGLWDSNFDVEVYGSDIDAVETLATNLIVACQGFTGAMGQTTVLAMFVSDHAEDYVSKVEMNTDSGLNVSHFALEIIH